MDPIEVSDPWFTHLVRGTKTVEGRKASPKWTKLYEGQEITFKLKDSDQTATAKIVRITTYNTLADYLVNEGLRQTLPGKSTLEEGLAVYQEWSTPEELQAYKFLGIEVRMVPAPVPTSSAEATLNVIGALAYNIRLTYYDIKKRCELIKKLARQIDRQDLIDWLDENYEELSENGRIIQGWPGGYGSCSTHDLMCVGLDLHIFETRAKNV